jgi:predicted Fe-S protein YdhL (DUF1289 family)
MAAHPSRMACAGSRRAVRLRGTTQAVTGFLPVGLLLCTTEPYGCMAACMAPSHTVKPAAAQWISAKNGSRKAVWLLMQMQTHRRKANAMEKMKKSHTALQ